MSEFDAVVEGVRRLQPGRAFAISRRRIDQLRFCPTGWNGADWALENVAGSAYEWSYSYNDEKDEFVFRRLKEPLTSASGLRTYVSPDRRHHFERLPNGLWRAKA